jgi:hypothetical protein
MRRLKFHPPVTKKSNARSNFFKKWGVSINKNTLHNRKKILVFLPSRGIL